MGRHVRLYLLPAFLENIGDLYVETRDYRNALVQYQEGIEELIPSFKPESIYDNPVIEAENNLEELTTEEQRTLLDLFVSMGEGFALLFERSNETQDIAHGIDLHLVESHFLHFDLDSLDNRLFLAAFAGQSNHVA